MKKLLILAVLLISCGSTSGKEPVTIVVVNQTPVWTPAVSATPTSTSTVVPSPTPSPTDTPDPFDSAIPCNDSHTKFLMCHVPSGNPTEKDLKCLKRQAIESHLQNHLLDFLVVDHDSAEGCTEE